MGLDLRVPWAAHQNQRSGWGWVCEKENMCGCESGRASVCGSRSLGKQLRRSRQRICHCSVLLCWALLSTSVEAIVREPQGPHGRRLWKTTLPQGPWDTDRCSKPHCWDPKSPSTQTSHADSVSLNCVPWRIGWLRQPPVLRACPAILVNWAPSSSQSQQWSAQWS